MFSPAARKSEVNAVVGEELMRVWESGNARYRIALVGLFVTVLLQLSPLMTYAQRGWAITELAMGWSVMADVESCTLFCHVSVPFISVSEGCLDVSSCWLLLLLLLLIGTSYR